MKKRFADEQIIGFLREAEADLPVMEFVGEAMLTWADERGTILRLTKRGKPNRSAYIESRNGRLLDECLNEHWFASLAHSRTVIEAWRREYNGQRPKNGLEPDALSLLEDFDRMGSYR